MQRKELIIDIDGRRLAGIEYGDTAAQEVVIALHGWLDNAASFHWLAPRLRGKRVLALDLAGHGRSDWRAPGCWYAIWDYVLDLDAALTTLGLRPVHLLGHSLGAAVVSLFAAAQPQRVASLVMLEGLGPLTQTAAAAPQQLAAALAWRHAESKAQPRYADRERMARARAQGRFPVALEAARLLVERGSECIDGRFVWRHDPRLLAPSVMRMTDAQVEAFMADVSVPTLVCLTSDGIATPAARQRLERIAGATIVDLEGGHHPHLEPDRVERVAATLNDFYAEVRRRTQAREVTV
jgi:pimeloyl-ACP methyl ester carboxylesterase